MGDLPSNVQPPCCGRCFVALSGLPPRAVQGRAGVVYNRELGSSPKCSGRNGGWPAKTWGSIGGSIHSTSYDLLVLDIARRSPPEPKGGRADGHSITQIGCPLPPFAN